MTETVCSSPACAMREADDVYMGYAGRDELAEALGRLLAATAADGPWRAMLAGHLAALTGGAPSTDDAKPALLIGDGTAQPARLLRELLPRVRDDRLHADLSAMLRRYDEGSEAASAS